MTEKPQPSEESRIHYFEEVANPARQHVALHNMIAYYDWTKAWVEFGGGSNHYRLVASTHVSFCPMCGLSKGALQMVDRGFLVGLGKWPNEAVTEVDLYPPVLDWP